MIRNGTELSMVRGDTEEILVGMKEKDGEAIAFIDGDTVYFTIKTSIYTDVKSLQKVVTTFDDGKALILIDANDTKSKEYGLYRYDIQLSRANGKVTTLVEDSPFIIKGEVTDD